MKYLLTVLLGSCLISLPSLAQYSRYVIEFKDKAGTPFSLSNPSAYLSQRAIERRQRFNISVDSLDIPVVSRYLDSLRAVPNVTVLNWSKWMNQAAIQTSDPAALIKIQSFPFVKSASAVAPRINPFPGTHKKFDQETVSTTGINTVSRVENLEVNYGQTYNQVHIHNGEFLHDRGLLGQGMVIAVLDGGYASYKTNPAFDSIRLNGQVLGEWDFVHNAQNTDGFSGHGMNCLSTIAANRPGLMVGSSPASGFWLLVTEDVSSEYPVEEHFWICGAEFADSVGADVLSSSLGYQDFDDPSFDHLYPERDGKTTKITRAANIAARKGMIVMVSAGNNGAQTSQLKYISCPADADSAVAVGAVSSAGTIASFSSWGPNAAGKTKPDVVSVGVATVVANAAGNPVTGNGTSFANPNMAGLVTCLWQAFPSFSNMEVVDALKKSADRFANPDERYGYGIPNMRRAFYLLKAEQSREQYGGDGWFKVNPNPFDGEVKADFIADNTGDVKLYLSDARGIAIDSASFTCDSLDYKTHLFAGLSGLPGGIYLVRYKSAAKDTSIALTKSSALFNNDWLRVFPNPSDGELMVAFKSRVNGSASLQLFTLGGKLVASQRVQTIQQDQVYTVDFSNIKPVSAGIFILYFDDGTHRRSIKVFRN